MLQEPWFRNGGLKTMASLYLIGQNTDPKRESCVIVKMKMRDTRTNNAIELKNNLGSQNFSAGPQTDGLHPVIHSTSSDSNT